MPKKACSTEGCSSTRLVFEGLCREHYLETVHTGQPLTPTQLEPLFFHPNAAAGHHLSRSRHENLFLAHDGFCGMCEENYPDVINFDSSCCPGGPSCGFCVRGLVCTRCSRILALISESVDDAQRRIEEGHPQPEVLLKAVVFLETYEGIRKAGRVAGAESSFALR